MLTEHSVYMVHVCGSVRVSVRVMPFLRRGL